MITQDAHAAFDPQAPPGYRIMVAIPKLARQMADVRSKG